MSGNFSHDDYHVAWISALPLEAAAARVMLEKEHRNLQKPPSDNNSYILGEVLGHNVVIACLPSGVYGTVSATATVVQLRSTFKAIKFALMVGIGGGVPSEANDIRLGDVVVSKPGGIFGGVVQYDLGKSVQEEPFQRSGTLNKPPQFLLAAMGNLESRYLVGQGQLANILSNALEKSFAIKATFRKPKYGKDQLYRAEYSHVADRESCDHCSSDRLVERLKRNPDEPRVYGGLIASGNSVMKDGRVRDQLAHSIPGILCFEMEAAGLMDHIPSLVIRGICDYSDSHKNNDWQPYAAVTAAAYAKELLSTIPNRRQDKGRDGDHPSIPSKPSPSVLSLLNEHFEDFKKMVHDTNPNDDVLFRESKAEDVYKKARDIEKELESKGCLRNMRRIVGFLDALAIFKRQLARIEDMSSFTDNTGFAASNDIEAIGNLISTYDRIATVMPRFENARNDWTTDQYGVSIMVLIFVNIIDLHSELYNLLHDKCTSVFHRTSWSSFERRLRLIVDNCAEYCERLYNIKGNEISTSEIVSRGRNALVEVRENENQRSIRELQAVLSWIGIEEDTQDNELDRLHSLKHPGSCEWMLKNKKTRSWFRLGHEEPIIWLTGIPGAGKSVLAASIVHKVKNDDHLEALYYFCGSQPSEKPASFLAFQSFVAHAARSSPGCASHIYHEHIQKGYSPSLSRLKEILEATLPALAPARIVLDGVDELPGEEQTRLLKSIIPLSRSKDGELVCKLLISSRDITNIGVQLSRMSRIDLNSERSFRDVAIESFIRDEVKYLRVSFDDIDADGELVGDIEDEMIEKAEGMFLWVRLVLSSIGKVRRLADLRDVVRTLPKGLENMYGRIVQGMLDSASGSDRIQTVKILSWALFGVQPLRITDILHGASIDPENLNFDEEYRLRRSALDLCKPLLEERRDGTVRFIHSTVHQYFLKNQGTRFIDPMNGHFAIAFACTAYLSVGLDLVHPNCHPSQQHREVLQGIHGLCRYARENWMYHIQQYCDKSTGEETEQLQLLKNQIRMVYAKHRSLEDDYPNFRQSQENRLPRPRVDDMCFHFLKDFPDIVVFIQGCFEFQLTLRKQVFSSGEDIDKYMSQHDPSLFGRMLQTYDTVVQLLSTSRSVDSNWDKRRLAKFKDQFGPSAFPCRFVGCIDTFSKTEARLDHELSRHIARSTPITTLEELKRVAGEYNDGTANAGQQQPQMNTAALQYIIPREIPIAREQLGAQVQYLSDDQLGELLHRNRQKQLRELAQNRASQAQAQAQAQAVQQPPVNAPATTTQVPQSQNGTNISSGTSKLNRNISDIYQDELYNPAIMSTSSVSKSATDQQQKEQESVSVPSGSIIADRLHAAKEQQEFLHQRILLQQQQQQQQEQQQQHGGTQGLTSAQLAAMQADPGMRPVNLQMRHEQSPNIQGQDHYLTLDRALKQMQEGVHQVSQAQQENNIFLQSARNILLQSGQHKPRQNMQDARRVTPQPQPTGTQGLTTTPLRPVNTQIHHIQDQDFQSPLTSPAKNQETVLFNGLPPQHDPDWQQFEPLDVQQEPYSGLYPPYPPEPGNSGSPVDWMTRFDPRGPEQRLEPGQSDHSYGPLSDYLVDYTSKSDVELSPARLPTPSVYDSSHAIYNDPGAPAYHPVSDFAPSPPPRPELFSIFGAPSPELPSASTPNPNSNSSNNIELPPVSELPSPSSFYPEWGLYRNPKDNATFPNPYLSSSKAVDPDVISLTPKPEGYRPSNLPGVPQQDDSNSPDIPYVVPASWHDPSGRDLSGMIFK
ncbi:hypothetical protein FE257_011627 [Aspergillus nanangensis]|uniref:C2H2-type domain-containing protein n=1 Tax=Aspergillus nanangensis TaxID=2582783 RepID=A0AAD4GWW3_ASPNN|nr:hypothetical protein FE257_011627 [Aspergillus nanangensis]